MQKTCAHNSRNESQITFVCAPRHEFATPDEFYAAVTRHLWEEWDSVINAEKYIANANKLSRTIDDLKKEIAACLSITPINNPPIDSPPIDSPPIDNFPPALDNIEGVISFRDDWNTREFVWYSDTTYWLMSWGTSA